MACAGFLCFAKVLRNKRLFHLINKAFLFRNSLINKCWLVLFYTSCRLTVTSCHHRNLTSAGLPAGRAFARKYHYHRYLSSLSASSSLAAVHRNNPDYYSAFLWLVGLPTITAKYLFKVIQL